MEYDNGSIDLSYKCNNNCIFCFTGNRYDKDRKFIDVIKNLISIKKKGIEAINLTGGEPTLYENLDKIVYYARRIGFNTINIVSNGTGFKDREFTERLLDAGLNMITISLHADKRELHDSITRREGSFDEIIKGLTNLKALKSKYKFIFGINFTVFHLNDKSLLNTIKMVHESFGPNFINLHFENNYTFGADKIAIQHLIESLRKYIDEESISSVKLFNIPYCYAKGLENIVVGDYNKIRSGDIYGEIINTDDLKYRKRLKNEDCVECKYVSNCYGIVLQNLYNDDKQLANLTYNFDKGKQ